MARLAGVSRATVSRILNGDDQPFPPTTRRRVHEAATKLSYRPSGAARSLVRGHSDTVVIVTPDTRFSGHLQDSVDQVTSQVQPFGGNVVVRVASATNQVTIEALLGVRPFIVLNFGVLSPADVEILVQRGIVVVPEPSSTDAEPRDPGVAALQATTLRRNGDRPLWYATTADENPEPFSRERFTALVDYCAGQGLAPPEAVSVHLDVAGGSRALSIILREHERAAVACYNDEVALTLLAGARELGIEVPGRVALVGMDDSIAARLWAPRLTTVHVDMKGFIADLVAQLRDQLEPHETSRRVPVESFFTIVEGETG